MTPTDLLFVLCFGVVIMWAGHWIREWEDRDLERQFGDLIGGLVPGDIIQFQYEIGKMTYDLLNLKPVNPETDPTKSIHSGN